MRTLSMKLFSAINVFVLAFMITFAAAPASAQSVPIQETSTELDTMVRDMWTRWRTQGRGDPETWHERDWVTDLDMNGSPTFRFTNLNGVPGYIVNGVRYDVVDPSGLSQLSSVQRMAVYAYCEDRQSGGGVFDSSGNQHATCGSVSPPPSVVEGATEDVWEARYAEQGGMALRLFRYAMGVEEGAEGQCITCTFFDNFLDALAGFSASVFMYFRGAMVVIAPICMGIWIAWKTSALMLTGGEDGRSYVYSILGRMALFFFIWAAFSPNEETTTHYGGQYTTLAYGWELTGPRYLDFAFGISNEIRGATFNSDTTAVSNFNPGDQRTAFQCNYTADAVSSPESDTSQFSGSVTGYKANAMNVACATERSHMVGIATGMAVLVTSGKDMDLNAIGIGMAIIKMISGLFLMVIFGLSAIWFVFLILDVAVRGFITAAFSPLIATLALFHPTRYIAVSAVKSMAGAVMTAIGIGIVSTLAYFLLTNTVNVYNDLVPVYADKFGDKPLTPVEIVNGNSIRAYEMFLVRIQSSEPTIDSIPMDLGTPWLWYLVLSGLAIYSLGKKIIAMLENMIGVGGMSAMADNAMKMTQTGVSLSMQATTALGAGSMAATKLFGGGASQAAGAAGGAAGASGLLDQMTPFGAKAGSTIDQGTNTLVNTISGGVEQDGTQ